MKERPILMSRPNIHPILEDRKNQTRRIIQKLQKFGKITEFGISDTPGYDWHFRDRAMRWHDISHAQLLELCPHGQPGDRLWVREAHYLTDNGHSEYAVYAADGDAVREHLAAIDELPSEFPESVKKQHRKLRPSIHMPRWASRILLEIVDVRVERLRDISEEDAKGEGVEPYGDCYCLPYRRLWESINGAGSWNVNPWIWVVEFRRIEP